jgi:hypothetical protein
MNTITIKTQTATIGSQNNMVWGQGQEYQSVQNRTKYFVGFLDVLGLSNLIRACEIRDLELQVIYNSLYRVIKNLKDAILKDPKQEKNPSYTSYKPYGGEAKKIKEDVKSYIHEILTDNYVNFSDSIIFYINDPRNNTDDSQNRFAALCWLINRYICKSIINPEREDTRQIALRGAIAYGDAIMHENIHIGQPIIDAFHLSETLNWMGCEMHTTVPKEFLKPLFGHNNEIFEYGEIPKKDKKTKREFYTKGYALNWVSHHPVGEVEYNDEKYEYKKKYGGLKKWPRPLFEDIGGHVGYYAWGREEAKRYNTLKFVKKICDEYDAHDSDLPMGGLK